MTLAGFILSAVLLIGAVLLAYGAASGRSDSRRRATMMFLSLILIAGSLLTVALIMHENGRARLHADLVRLTDPSVATLAPQEAAIHRALVTANANRARSEVGSLQPWSLMVSSLLLGLAGGRLFSLLAGPMGGLFSRPKVHPAHEATAPTP